MRIHQIPKYLIFFLNILYKRYKALIILLTFIKSLFCIKYFDIITKLFNRPENSGRFLFTLSGYEIEYVMLVDFIGGV